MQILLTGASGQIGDFLLPKAVAAGHRPRAVSRQPRTDAAGVHWVQADLDDPHALQQVAGECEVLIHMAPVWTLPAQLPALANSGIQRILTFSSTSRFGKANSADPHERDVVNRLIQAEDALVEHCAAAGIHWTLFRPTLIYGVGRDQNVTSIKRFVERYGFFVIAGEGTGLRQPVHAADLANACLGALDNPAAFDKAYNLSGGETLSYRAMVERVFASLGRKPRIISLPLPPLRLLLRAASLLPGYGYVSPEMADRMNRDLVYGHREARADFAYTPSEFKP